MEKQEHTPLLYPIPLEQNKLFLYSVSCHTAEGPSFYTEEIPNKLQTENFSVCIACLNIFPGHSKFLFKFTWGHTNISVLGPPHAQDPDPQAPSSTTSLKFRTPSLSRSTHVSGIRQQDQKIKTTTCMAYSSPGRTIWHSCRISYGSYILKSVLTDECLHFLFG